MLKNDRVTLIPMDAVEISDEYVGWLNDPVTFRFLGTKFGQTKATVRKYVEAITAPNTLCKILVPPDMRHVGNIALHMFDSTHRIMEIGIIIGDTEARGKGLAREACQLIIDFGFRHLNLNKITAGTVVENLAMTRTFLSLGFRIEGTLVQHYYLDGKYLDLHRFGLLRSEYFEGVTQ